MTLNRVTGRGNASQIYGVLSANGNIILVNPQGVVIGAGAQVNVGGLVATTSNVRDEDFMNGKLVFEATGNPSASIINKGNITIADGGLVALVGPNVSNEGLIKAKLGRVHLASGDVFTIDLYGDGLINVQASENLTKQLLANSGEIAADGGEIIMTAAAAETTIDSLINMDGLLQANSVGEKNGHIVLNAEKGTTKVAGKIDAKGTAAGEKGGFVETSGQSVDISGTVDVSAVDGAAGEWLIDPQNIRIMSASCPWYGCIGYSRVSTSSVQNTLNAGGNVTITTSGDLAYLLQAGDITVVDSITKTNGNTATLTLNAHNDVVLNNGVTISSTKNGLNVILTADKDHNGSGSVYMNGSAAIRTNGGAVSFSGDNIVMDGFFDVLSWSYKTPSIVTAGGIVNMAAKGSIDMNDGAFISTGGMAAVLKADGAVGIKDSTIATNGGNIVVVGAGTGPWTGGVEIDESNLNAGVGNIIVFGTGYSSSLWGASYGVKIDDSRLETQGAGTVSISGVGGNSGISLAGLNNYGVRVDDTNIIANGAGSIKIVGSGGSSVNFLDVSNYGVELEDSIIASNGGDVGIMGLGGSDTSVLGFSNGGLSMEDSTVKTTSGTIVLTGVGGGGQSLLGDTAYGIAASGTNRIGGAGDTGEISFIADTMKVKNRMYVETTGNTTFKTYTDAASIGVAGANGTLQVTKKILDDVTAGSVTIGDLADGAGVLTANGYTWRSHALFLTNTGEIVIAGQQNLGSHRFLAHTSGGSIRIGAAGGVSSAASGTAITLAASYGNFTNQSGADALSTADGGRWLIYSTNPSLDTMDGLSSSFHRFSCVYGGSCPDFSAETGNGNLYRFTPYLNVLANNTTTVYGDPATYSYSLSGYLMGDETADAVTGGVTYGSSYMVGSNAGSYDISVIGGTLSSAIGYGFTYGTVNNGGLTVAKAPLTVIADNKTVSFGAPFPPFTYTASGFKLGDTESLFTGNLTTTASIGTGYGDFPIQQGTLSAGGNYDIAFTDGVLTINVPFGDINAADKQGKYDPPVTRGLGYKGVLLAMANAPGGLGALAPAAGGYRPMTPEELSNLAPAAGGPAAGAPGTGGTVMALIECDDDAPCQINQ